MTGKATKDGLYHETLAAKHLKRQGLKIIERNVRYREGELDLIALDQQSLVFIEVKKRVSQGYGHAIETITPSKINKLRKAAQHYLLAHPEHQHRNCRFDVVTFSYTGSSKKPDCQWLKNAFA